MQTDSYIYSPGITNIPREDLKEKRKPLFKVTGLLRDRYFWYVVILAGFVTIFSYAPNLIFFIGLESRPNWELAYYIALYRVTFQISVAIAAWKFGISGGMITSITLAPIIFSPFFVGLQDHLFVVDIGVVALGMVVSLIIGRQGNLQRLLAKTAEELIQQADQLRLEIQERMKAEKELRSLSLSAIESLVFALEAKDKYTAGHSRRVTDMALSIGKRLTLSADELDDLRYSSLLHDIGKIAVEQFIQNKPNTLTSYEYERMMIHVEAGANIVKPIVNDKVVQIIEHHHDYYDGKGLRQSVAGVKIPLGARIIAVADAYDAMTSDRPYRIAMCALDAMEELQKCSGTQFDPLVVNAFLKVLLTDITPAYR